MSKLTKAVRKTAKRVNSSPTAKFILQLLITQALHGLTTEERAALEAIKARLDSDGDGVVDAFDQAPNNADVQ